MLKVEVLAYSLARKYNCFGEPSDEVQIKAKFSLENGQQSNSFLDYEIILCFIQLTSD
jgi:hypothetical protein